jgi:hypothetical protein
MEAGRYDRITACQDHQQWTWRDQIDEPARRVFKDCGERTHGRLVPPSRRDSRLRLRAKVVAVQVGLQSKAFSRSTGVRNVAFAALCRVTNPLLDYQLLKLQTVRDQQARA